MLGGKAGLAGASRLDAFGFDVGVVNSTVGQVFNLPCCNGRLKTCPTNWIPTAETVLPR
jgi:hypothetical protein